MVDKYEDIEGLDEQLTPVLKKVNKQASKLKKDFQQMHYNQQSIVLYADELRNLMKDTAKSTSAINKEMKQWVFGAQELSKYVGHINRDAFNHTSNMVRLRKEYDQLGKIGKEFLKTVNFKGHFNIAASQLSQYKGLFLGTFKTLANFQIDVARNISQLGREGFDDLSGGLRDIDDQIQNVSQKLSKMATKQQIQLMDPHQQRGMIEVQKQTIKLMKDRVVLLQESRDNMYDTVQIQNILNQKLKPYMDHIDKVATGTEGLRKGLEGVSTVANTLGVDLIGLDQFSQKLDMTKPVQKLKAIVSQTAFKQAMSFKGVTKQGKINFKGLGKSIIGIMGGVTKMLTVMFIGAFTAISLGVVALMVAGFKKAWGIHQQYQDKFISAQRSAQVVSGRGTQANFGAVYSAMGGAEFGGQDASDVYQNARRYGSQLVTIAQNTRKLQRSFAVSTGDAAKILFNLKQVGGMTQKAAMQFTTRLGKMSQKFGIQSSKVLSQLADLSGDTMLHFAGMQQKFIRSSIFARKLNLTVQQMYRTMQGVSDVQDTMQKAMQLQVLTGKELNVQQLLYYANMGKGQQALALLFDTYGEGLKEITNPHTKKLIADMFKMDYSQIIEGYNAYSKGGKTASQILSQVDRVAEEAKDPISEIGQTLNNLNTFAAPLMKAMDALNTKIKQVFNKAFAGSVEKVQNLITNGRLVQIIQKIAIWLGRMTQHFINWVTAPGTISAIQGSLRKLYEGVKWFYGKIMTPIFNLFKWAYDKGGFKGVLGLAAGFATLFNIHKILLGIYKVYTMIAIIKKIDTLASVLGGGEGGGVGAIKTFTDAAGRLRYAKGTVIDGVAMGGKFAPKLAGQVGIGQGIAAVGGSAGAATTAIGSFLAVAAPVAVVAAAAGAGLYLWHKHLENTSPTGIAIKNLKSLKAQMQGNIDLSAQQIDLLNQQRQQMQSGMSTYNQLIRKKTLNRVQQQKLKFAYMDLLGQEEGIKRFNAGQKLSAQEMAKANKKLQDIQIQRMKLQRANHKERIKMQIVQMRMKSKQLALKKADGTALTRWLGGTDAGYFGKNYGSTITSIISLATEGKTNAAMSLIKGLQSDLTYQSAYQSLKPQAKAQIISLFSHIKSLSLTQESYESMFGELGFASGGVVKKPVRALVGQAGAQAILPLKDNIFSALAENITDKMQDKGSYSNDIISAIQKLSQRPIQVTIQMDHKKVGKILANNATFTPGIA